MKKINKSLLIKLSVVVISIIMYIMYLLIYFKLNRDVDQSKIVLVMSWVGMLLGVYILITWYKITGKVFSLYTIFMLFFFLFNYGQPLMWGIGIHKINEIGKVGLYRLGIPNSGEIVISQAITLASIVLFHLGSVIACKRNKNTTKNLVNTYENKLNRIAIYKTCVLVSFISIPVAFYNIIYMLIISNLYGYRAYYYSDNVTKIVIFNLIDKMFFPCLVGLIVGSNYNNRVKKIVYIIFVTYMLLALLSGDRGSWIYILIILIWMSHRFYKPLNFFKSIKIMLVSSISLYVISAIVSVRNIGINLENILNSFSLNDSAIISSIFEMGASMRPTIVLIKYGWNIWPYGNTYINSMLGIVSSKFITAVGREWAPLSDWFSQSYLGISYGAGFSIVAEALINFGPIFAPIFMIVIGYLITKLTYIDNYNKIEENPLKIFFSISTMSIFIPVVRNHFLWITKSWFYGVIILTVLILIVKSYIKKKSLLKDDYAIN